MKHELAIVGTLAILTSACDSQSRPSAPLRPSPPVAPTPTATTQYNLSGTVIDDNAAPVPGARVVVDYPVHSVAAGGTVQVPGRWISTQTDGRGRYVVDFEARSAPSSPFLLAVVQAGTEGGEYEGDAQLVATEGPAQIVKNLRLRRRQTIRVGESAVVSVEADSALCLDFDTLYSGNTLCGWVRVIVGPEESVKAEASPMDPGGVAPNVFVEAATAETYRVGLAIPVGSAPQRYVVTTSPRPRLP
jgi:hypothetical protein